jgi:phosphopantothenoylcysteine decarboxylase/phosphopantothenate--cysteine ligase
MNRPEPPPSAGSDSLAGHEVLFCVCGGIAAYKSCTVVSELVQRGVGVTVAMSRAARKFIGRATFEALTARRVLTDLWSPDVVTDSPHIRCTKAADATIVAPATANVIGKLASGVADDVVTTLLISAALPVLLAPGMNDRMWANPVVQSNVKRLSELGYSFVGPEEGWLACRSIGLGRMAEPEGILKAASDILLSKPARGRALNVE